MQSTYQTIRWIARIFSLFLIGTTIVYMSSDRPTDTDTLTIMTYTSLREQTLIIGLLISLIGLGYGWFRELSGGAVAITGNLLCLLVNFRWNGTVFILSFPALCGLLFVFAGLLRSKLFPQIDEDREVDTIDSAVEERE